jgi:hypothetical protein
MKQPSIKKRVLTFLAVVILMPFINSPFSCSKHDDAPRFVTEKAFRENLAKQMQMTPMTVAQLRKLGVTESKSLKLEFFFYTDTQAKAQSLATTLKEFQYEAHSRKSAGDSRTILVTGWSTPIKMDDGTVSAWTEKMCRAGFEHDAEFDGWGTSPD